MIQFQCSFIQVTNIFFIYLGKQRKLKYKLNASVKSYIDKLEKRRDGTYPEAPFLIIQERNVNKPWKEYEVRNILQFYRI